MQEKFLKLTNEVYKMLEFFPEADPLKNRAKDKALAIMDNLVLVNEVSGWASFSKEKIKVQLLEDIEILMGYLWIGKTQGWLNSVNFLIIANEYEKIKIGMEPISSPIVEQTQKLPGIDKPRIEAEVAPNLATESVEIEEIENDSSAQTDRQKKIMDFLSKNEKAQVMDLQTILPDITKRTIRRDLDELLQAGKIVRTGDFNQVSYQVKR
ncbi:MAG: DeoR family transcriptional regulator [Candidatus Staskawiczbacteria bacterium]|nr:DeoR family transcriptional regulator [Candidatus Staskawiczbacteria bacterium]